MNNPIVKKLLNKLGVNNFIEALTNDLGEARTAGLIKSLEKQIETNAGIVVDYAGQEWGLVKKVHKSKWQSIAHYDVAGMMTSKTMATVIDDKSITHMVAVRNGITTAVFVYGPQGACLKSDYDCSRNNLA
jgi:hypothetical protein